MDLESLIARTGINIENNGKPQNESIYEPIQSSDSENEQSRLLSNTAYIICEKKSFRSDAFVNMLAEEFKTDIIYTSYGNIPNIEDPLCFIVDMNSLIDDKVAQKILVYIQDVAYEKNVHIFLIGEQDELKNTKSVFNRKDITITQFKRPLDIKQCVDEIKDIILSTPVIRKKKHILVVDDSVMYLKILKRSLEREYRVTTASGAFEAITELARMDEVPDMMIVDQLMPVVDGFNFVKLVKEQTMNTDLKNIPVVFYSGDTNVDDTINLMPLIDYYIPKTESTMKLNNYVKKVFDKKKKERNSKERSNKKKKK